MAPSGLAGAVPSFRDFGEYASKSLFMPELAPPFTEPAHRVLGHFAAVCRFLRRRYAALPDTALVSLILPGSADAEGDARTLGAALGQSYRNIEVLYGSAAPAVVADARLRHVGVAPAAGPAAVRNACYAQARGAYLAWLDAQTAPEPDFVRILLGVLLETGAGCAYAAQRQTGAAGGESVRYAVFSRALLENRPYIALSSVLHRRDAVGGDAPFDERADAAADWLLLLRLTERCAARAVPCVLGHRQRAPTPTADAAAVDAWLAHERIAKVLDDAAVPGVERMFAPRFRPQPRQPRPVSIVIPSYECLDHLRLCLAALRRFTATPCEVIVVDNASSPPVQALLAQIESADTIIIRNRANAGFTRAVNQGIERAAPGHDIVLLNNDAVVTPGWLGALQRALEDLPDAGIVVPRQVLLPGTDTVAVHQPACDPQREIDVNLSAHHDNIVDAGLEPATGLIELSFAPFFCAYLPRGVVDALGPLDDEGAPHYRSDRLYCEAVRRLLGRRIVYTPHAKVYHFLQRATRALETRSPAEYQAYFVRNQRPAAEAP